MCTLWCTRCGGRSAELHSPGGGEWGACRRAATAQCRMQGSVLLRVGLALQSAVVCLQLKVNSCSSAQPPCPPPPRRRLQRRGGRRKHGVGALRTLHAYLRPQLWPLLPQVRPHSKLCSVCPVWSASATVSRCAAALWRSGAAACCAAAGPGVVVGGRGDPGRGDPPAHAHAPLADVCDAPPPPAAGPPRQPPTCWTRSSIAWKRKTGGTRRSSTSASSSPTGRATRWGLQGVAALLLLLLGRPSWVLCCAGTLGELAHRLYIRPACPHPSPAVPPPPPPILPRTRP